MYASLVFFGPFKKNIKKHGIHFNHFNHPNPKHPKKKTYHPSFYMGVELKIGGKTPKMDG